jgi:glycosyltransferase involved in cell wall biosynthesis
MRVGIASEWIGEQVGGLERQPADMIRSMIAADAENEYIIFVTARGARTLTGLANGRVHVRGTALSSRWYYVPVGLPLAVLRNRVDVLHATFSVVPWCPARRIVLTVHDVCPDVHPEFFPRAIRTRFRWLMLQGLARCARVIVPSHATKRELLQHYRVEPERVVVIPNGVRHDMVDAQYGAYPQAAPFDEQRWPRDFVLYVGRFHARKNIDRLLEAFARSRSRRNGLRLVLAGRDLWSGERIARRIRELHLEQEVVCPGHVPDTTLAELYRRARVFAFPSLHEGFGIPPVEAMAYGVPVLACSISAMPEVLGDAAHYTDPYDVAAMADALDQVVEDDALRTELVHRGRTQLRRYAWPQIAERTLDVYREIQAIPA